MGKRDLSMSINCSYNLIIEIMSENTENKISLYIILFVIGMGLLSALSSCSPKMNNSRFAQCYTFKR